MTTLTDVLTTITIVLVILLALLAIGTGAARLVTRSRTR